MDLGAYMNITDIEDIAKQNGIDVPRLRGYRLMGEEKPVNIKEMIDKNQIAVSCVESLCESEPFWNTHSKWYISNYWTSYLKSYFLVKSKDENGYTNYIDVRWDRIHGWKRKVLKTYIHNEIVRQRKQWEVWNKYAGREDILYIHARIGGNNWSYYSSEVINQPWFIEKVDDSFDSTYCDIYAQLNINCDKKIKDNF